MIIVQLTGGLGNQLFQYAMGRMLALKHNTQLKLDISFFETYEWHEYSLAPFLLEAVVASKAEVHDMVKKNNRYCERLKQRIFKTQPIVINEKSLEFNSSYLQIRNNRYLIGYWQSEKYFINIESFLRKELMIKIEPSAINLQILKEIKTNNQSVSLHIRRGNYVNVESVNKVHGTTKLNYYYEAIKTIAKICEQPVFYIFSDDINWAKENLKLSYKHVYIDHNSAKKDYEDLRLMSACKHNILANSTFSWWGAWLNVNKEKIIIAPREWFADPEKNKESESIIPKTWVRL
ncbi:MAG: alpha-1,2-fucosyltransferase [Sediminibacterium sp.]|nr:alpha-1,2-fucosyltransferase [Sediminibacterium sp.]